MHFLFGSATTAQLGNLFGEPNLNAGYLLSHRPTSDTVEAYAINLSITLLKMQT